MRKLNGFEEHLVLPGFPVRDALIYLNEVSHKFLLVVDTQHRLLGTVTDGDIRRGILQGVGLDEPIELCMFSQPTVGTLDDQPATIRDRIEGLLFLPIVNVNGSVEDVLLPEKAADGILEAVIMAGGLGTRLGAITETTPKPLLQVGGQAILQHIMASLETAGVTRIWLSVNHLADRFEEFVEKRDSGTTEIRLLREASRLGTAGSLSLLPERPVQPILVLNGDVLTQVDYRALEAFHRSHSFDGTIAVAHHQIQLPFGVVNHDQQGLFTGVSEKPILKHFVAAGIYYLSPDIVSLVPKNRRVDMPEILSEAHKIGMRLGIFPIHEYWTDVGRPEDLRAADEYHWSMDK